MGVIVVFIVKYEIVGEDSGCNDEKTYYLWKRKEMRGTSQNSAPSVSN